VIDGEQPPTPSVRMFVRVVVRRIVSMDVIDGGAAHSGSWLLGTAAARRFAGVGINSTS
jgi:hypothetical protein